jgi:hypothetical protein
MDNWTGISQSLDKYLKGHSHLGATQALPLRGSVTLTLKNYTVL